MGRRFALRTADQATGWIKVSVVSLLLLAASGCASADDYNVSNLGVPERDATTQAEPMFNLWVWSWVAAMAVGVVVWGLMFYAAIRYRRRSDADIPVQTRSNVPLEAFYLVAPTVMCVVFFYHTLKAQDEVLAMSENPDQNITVVGQKWGFTFNYETESGEYVYSQSGTVAEPATLVLPVDESVHFDLYSPDVIHSFWIPAFMMKMDIVPGRENAFQVNPTKTGEFDGKCAELCGAYHSRMLFNVKVVTAEEFDAYLRDLEAEGNISEEPVMGGKLIGQHVGLDKEGGEE